MNSARSELADIIKKSHLYLSLGRFEAAEKLLKATLTDQGPLANIYNMLGLTYHKQSRFVEAVHAFHDALQVNPNFIEAALNLTATLCDLSRYEDAQKVFSQLSEQLTAQKKAPPLLLGRLANQHVSNGQAYQESDMLSEAASEFRKGLALYPNMPDVRISLAKILVRLGQQEKAKTELEAILETHPDHCEAHNWLGILYFKLGRKDKAKRHWEKAQQIRPDDATSRAYLKISRDWAAEA